MLAAVVVLAGGALMTANAASNTVPPSNAGEHTEAAPAFNFENTPDYYAIRSDGGSTAPIVSFFALYPGGDAIESVQVYAIRDGVVDATTSVTVLFSDLGSAPYDNPILLDMESLTAADPTAWSTVDSMRVDFYDVDATRLGIAYILP